MLNLSASQITTFYECNRRWYYTYINRKTKNSTGAMDKGSCFHFCHELHYKDKIGLREIPEAIKERKPEYESVMPEVFPAFIRYTGDQGGYEIIELNGEPAIEVNFQLQIADDITIRGMIDRIQQQGVRKYITDLKVTSSYLNDNFFSKFEMSIQAMLYSLVGREYFDRLDGFLIDAVQIGKKYDNKIQFFPLLPTIEQFVSELHRIGKSIIANLDNKDFFIHNYSSCINRYGHRCNFFEVCRAKNEMQEVILNSSEFVDYKSPYDKPKEIEDV